MCRGQEKFHHHSGTCAGLLRSTGRDVRGKRGGGFESSRRDVLSLHFFAGHVGSDVDEVWLVGIWYVAVCFGGIIIIRRRVECGEDRGMRDMLWRGRSRNSGVDYN